jgi:hypothetical protein
LFLILRLIPRPDKLTLAYLLIGVACFATEELVRASAANFADGSRHLVIK